MDDHAAECKTNLKQRSDSSSCLKIAANLRGVCWAQTNHSALHHCTCCRPRPDGDKEIHANDHPFARHNEKEIVRMRIKINKIKREGFEEIRHNSIDTSPAGWMQVNLNRLPPGPSAHKSKLNRLPPGPSAHKPKLNRLPPGSSTHKPRLNTFSYNHINTSPCKWPKPIRTSQGLV